MSVISTRSTDGTSVHATAEGEGPAILIVGPGMDDGAGWQKVAARLSTRFRVVRLHRRRYQLDIAATSWPVAQEVDDVLAVAAVIGEPVLIVGHSSGGVVALEAMVASPSTFTGAVLYDPSILISTAEWRPAVDQAKAALAAGKPGKAMAIFLRDVIRMPPWAARLSGAYVAVNPTWRALTPRQIDDADAIDRLGVRLDTYAEVNVPTVLLSGKRGPAHLAERIDALAHTLPWAKKAALRGQGHSAHRSAPDEVAHVITTLATEVSP